MAPTGDRAAVALIIHRRPAETRRVFDAIREARPSRLFVIADGPADAVQAEVVAAARSATDDVDWPCDVTRVYSRTHLGCRERVLTGLDAVFAEVSQAILLEDDCLPDRTFFGFAEDLLERYRTEDRVMSIGGHLWHLPDGFTPDSYWFSAYPATWGWATWSSAWKHYSDAAAAWPSVKESDWLEDRFGGRTVAAQFWRRALDSEAAGNSTWDYTWTLAHWLHGSLAARASTNLISNIGFGADATHTVDLRHPSAARPASSVPLPLQHPPEIQADPARDHELESAVHSGVIRRRMTLARSRIPLAEAGGEVRG